MCDTSDVTKNTTDLKNYVRKRARNAHVKIYDAHEVYVQVTYTSK